ncbi:MAG: phage terminase large subunit [Alphaproteobacteria bacterium]
MAESFKHNITEADFKLFMVLWNQMQGQSTPVLHLKMANWLERAWKTGQRQLLLQAFRSAGKSTIVGLFAAWLLYRASDLRILVLAADEVLAGKMVRNVKRIIERHPLTAHMKPDNADQWASERFTVRRNMELRDPSMLAKGITSNITGSRADIVICDDVEVPNTCDTAEKRENLRARLSEISFVLVPDGTQLYVGTPHTFYTIYADIPRKDLGEEAPFLHGFHALKMPVLDENRQSAWPERYSEREIEKMRLRAGPNRFTSQMMLQPVNIAEGRLNPDKLKLYEDGLDYTKEINTLFLGRRKIRSASAWWDPSFASAKGDCSVLAVIYSDEAGDKFLHHLEYITLPEQGNADEATAQCRIVAGLCKQFMLPSLTIEINGIGRFLPGILRNELAKAHVPTRVQEFSNSRPKDIRIIEAFDALLAAERLHIHRSVLKTPFISEMREWRPEVSKGHDDGLDAVAGALSLEPVRVERIYGKGAFNWYRGSKSQKAKTDFNV